MPSLTLISDHSAERLTQLIAAQAAEWQVHNVDGYQPLLQARALPEAEARQHVGHLNLCTQGIRELFYATPTPERPFFAERMRKDIFEALLAIEERGYRPLINTFALPRERLFGNFSIKEPSSFATQVRRLNAMLGDLVAAHPQMLLLDVEHLAAMHGVSRWLDERYWFHSKYPCKPSQLPHLATEISAILRSLSGKTTKCIVVDLDNTLWSGVIGDDGLEGIRLGGQGEGEAHQTFQQYLKSLQQRGLLLAVCSKNEEAAARLPFQHHSGMALKEEDFVAFKANWEKKSDNIRAIAAELNLGLDSFIFLDDSAFERAEVRASLPEVAVPDLPADPAMFVPTLEASSWWEAVTPLSTTDHERTAWYRQHAQRDSLARAASSHTEFLQSLGMIGRFAEATPAELGRVAQLIQRSNQFNLRTQRLGPERLQALHEQDEGFVLGCTLRDRYGDHGLIAAICGEIQDGVLFIEEFVMSCRVLSRGVEEFVCNQLAHFAQSRGGKRILGEYIPTSKNQLVAQLYPKLGFVSVPEKPGCFVLDLQNILNHETFIKPNA